MNVLKAIISDIQKVDNLHIVRFDCEGVSLEMMSLELSDNTKIHSHVHVAIKPTHIALAKNIDAAILTHPNQLKAEVISYEHGELLSSITLHVKSQKLEVILTKASAVKLDLHVEDNVIALINASELSIVEVLDA